MAGLWAVIGLVAGALIASAAMWFYLKPRNEQIYEDLQKEVELKRTTAEKDASATIKSAQQEAKQLRLEAEKVTGQRYKDLARAEERVDIRTEKLDTQTKNLEQREQTLNKRQSRLDRRQNELEKTTQQHREKLEEVAAMSSEDAKQVLLQEVEKEARQDMARLMREIEDKAKETAEAKARGYIAMAIQRVASDQVAEITVSTVPLPKEEMKGRIIGRNGRNIRAFEQAAGVDVVVDDTPEAVTVSSFDPVRREVARRAMERLIVDGRIHPARIEKLIKDAQKEVEKDIKDAGEQAAYEANVHGLHPQILAKLGPLEIPHLLRSKSIASFCRSSQDCCRVGI